MNRRVLLAWELGGGRGHTYILGWIARALRRRGFEPILAVQQLETLEAIGGLLDDGTALQAPVWPTLQSNRPPAASVSLGDILADLGLRAPSAMRHVLNAWDRLLDLTKPAAVVADYAPGLLLVARGRYPTIAVGDGFTVPPADMENFPVLEGEARSPKYDEQQLLAGVNECLHDLSRPALAHLPEIFAADRVCVGSFAEFDLYREHRRHPSAGPWLHDWNSKVAREGDEIFGYFSIASNLEAVLVKALRKIVDQGVTVRMHMPQLGAEATALLEALGVAVERTPIPFKEIQRRSRLVMSLGSLGFVSSSLVAGIPQILLPPNLALRRAGATITELGVGRSLTINAENPLEPALLAQTIFETLNDSSLATQAKEIAPDFARRLEPRPQEVVADFVEELVGRI
jgi:rhamnosyltransferase subunit B